MNGGSIPATGQNSILPVLPGCNRLLAWLVEDHLLMSGTAQKEDIQDPAVVAKVQFMTPVSDADRETYLKLWQDLKAQQ